MEKRRIGKREEGRKERGEREREGGREGGGWLWDAGGAVERIYGATETELRHTE